VATWNKFQAWPETMVEVANLGTDQFVIALTNSAPIATNSVLADLTQISYTNLSSRNLVTASSTQTGGTYNLTFNDLVLTASGAVATFRYVVVYDDTPTSPADPLVGWWDYGSTITMANGETFTIDFTGAAITLS
jgi:hypothetical protein